MPHLGKPPSILNIYPLDEAIEKADKQVLQQICVAMEVMGREGNRQTLIKNLKPKMPDIQEWIEEYRSIDDYQPTHDFCGALDWTTTLERTFGKKNRKRETRRNSLRTPIQIGHKYASFVLSRYTS